ncbi:MAG: methionine--tRNA ligase [Candidatus Pacebacteria bacterium]|nr:methionine--tRNA ligase [Candidatus Paceibacterota bacterium]MBT4652236.1 methionine--tRNA ligase [Candidatus Paceibacterota bacterium]MBT6756648.1 methionine--tRNA ligase [Candidatus Paceibacterota bacterium]MBT6921436.1 methionine--tRNA ligase [Candidatus Paceibacterota bacterium]
MRYNNQVKNSNFYLTTTLPYVNAEPHIGFALEIVAGDVITRYQRDILNKKVVFNTGTDEHGQKIYQKALENNQEPQAYVDYYATKFEELKEILDLGYTNFIRTTDKNHVKAAQHFWELCNENGYIYKKEYKTKYCVGCELEKTDSELTDGCCPLHPNKDIEFREEENYFFKFSAFQQPLLDLYKDNPEFVKPDSKMKEITAFVKNGLQDFSISRLKEKMPWGIQVPGDENHVMYVWFDALVNYISTLGWPDEKGEFADFWPGVQVAGKDNLRQQSAMWQAMLLAAGVSPSKQILINGFISVDGQKMSKSIGNVISPREMVARYGTDATRYLLMNLGPFGTDMDVSWEKFDVTYTAFLANGIGNLCSRVAKLCEKTQLHNTTQKPSIPIEYNDSLENSEILTALKLTQNIQDKLDKFFAEKQPWKQSPDEAEVTLLEAVTKIRLVATMISPFMPAIGQKITNHFSQEKISAITPLFPRLEK